MIDEFFERQIDRLCEFVPAYCSPRFTRFTATRLGWRMYLYISAFKRRVGGAFSKIQWIEKEEAPTPAEQTAQEAEDPALMELDESTRKAVRAWHEENKRWAEKTREEQKRRRTLKQRLSDWWAGRHERAKKREARWDAREREADERAQRVMERMLPTISAIQKSRFGLMLLLSLLCVVGTVTTGSGDLAYLAAACCALWLSIAFDMDYTPISGQTRQIHLAATLLRALGFLFTLPAFYGGYMRQGVSSNVVLQSTMIVMLFTHAVFFVALVAFNRRQMLMLRALAGVCGVLPALGAASALALAATYLARPLPLPIAGLLMAVGALLTFAADRMITLRELGGIRLRYDAILVSVLLCGGMLMAICGAWMAAAPASAL